MVNGRVMVKPAIGWLFIQYQEVMIVNAGVDRARAHVLETMLDQHLGLAGDEAYLLVIDVPVP